MNTENKVTAQSHLAEGNLLPSAAERVLHPSSALLGFCMCLSTYSYLPATERVLGTAGQPPLIVLVSKDDAMADSAIAGLLFCCLKLLRVLSKKMCGQVQSEIK